MSGFELRNYNREIDQALKAGRLETWTDLVNARFAQNNMAVKVDTLVETHYAATVGGSDKFKLSAGIVALDMEHSLQATDAGKLAVASLYKPEPSGRTLMDRLVTAKGLASGRAISSHHALTFAMAQGNIPKPSRPAGAKQPGL